ncbi:agamous-like MADS-box protein AGL80 [Carica papaya]|uniref:agamous-like MADS-box protein AGL80 n=1 Tax=Carica papaya TaxID=3649 RepID=UPI000B8C81F9|nr:agamous-like MADS-box protein AGL80 [Carica papaya]
MVNQESFLRPRITKATDQIKKQCKDNREKEITHVMFQSLIGKPLHQLNLIDLNDLDWFIEQRLREIQKRMETLSQSPQPQEAMDGEVMKCPGKMYAQIPPQKLQLLQVWFVEGMNLQA